jgi:hypothetical protein
MGSSLLPLVAVWVSEALWLDELAALQAETARMATRLMRKINFFFICKSPFLDCYS